MTKFIEFSSIGVSKDSQHRAAKIMGVIYESYQDFKSHGSENFFEFGHRVMAGRWARLREVVAKNGVFSLPNFPKEFCLFHGDFTESFPGIYINNIILLILVDIILGLFYSLILWTIFPNSICMVEEQRRY